MFLAGWFCFCVSPSLLVLQCRALKRKARRQNMDVPPHKLWVLINHDSSKQRFPLFRLFVPGFCRNRVRKLDVPNTYIPSSTATSWQTSDQLFKNSIKVTQPSPRKINPIWKKYTWFSFKRDQFPSTAHSWCGNLSHATVWGLEQPPGLAVAVSIMQIPLLHPAGEMCSRGCHNSQRKSWFHSAKWDFLLPDTINPTRIVGHSDTHTCLTIIQFSPNTNVSEITVLKKNQD